MKKSRFSDRQILAILKQHEAGVPFAAHIRNNPDFRNFSVATADKEGVGPNGYVQVRGREQQLIDRRLDQLGVQEAGDTELVANRIRGVARLNPFGCLHYQSSNAQFGRIARYTGRIPATCAGGD